MNRKCSFRTANKWISLVLITVTLTFLISGCDIAGLLSQGNDFIDRFANASTDAATPENTPNGIIPGLPGMFTKPTEPADTAPTATSPVATTPPTAAPTEPAFVIDPDNIRNGIVISEYITLYKLPSQNADHAGSLKYGDRVEIYGEDNGWVYTAGGWAKGENFYLEGDEGEYHIGDSTVTGTEVNLRRGPGMDYDILGKHNTGDQIHILEEFFFDKLWWGYTGKGWICMDYVYNNGSMSENYGTGVITGDVVNVRKGPGTNYGVITTVKEGETVEVFNFFTIKNVKWACTNRGWICMDFMRYNPI